MKKKLAIVTGTSQGIGSVIAKGLALKGYRVVLIARNIDKLNAVYKEIIKVMYKGTGVGQDAINRM